MNTSKAPGRASESLSEQDVVDDEYARLPEQPSVTDRQAGERAAADQLADRIRQDPLAAVGAAFIAGAVLGLLLAR